MKMTPEQVINRRQLIQANNMGMEKTLGSICIGKKANFFITKEIPSYII